MTHGDVRSTRIVIVSDEVLTTLLDDLDRSGCGMMQLPPDEIHPETARLWIEQVAEHAAEFLRNGYAVVLLGETPWADELDAALVSLGASPLPRIEASPESVRQYAIQPPSTSRLTPET